MGVSWMGSIMGSIMCVKHLSFDFDFPQIGAQPCEAK